VVSKLEALVQEKEALQRELTRADEQLASMALTDAVSGLPNQRAFRDALARDLARGARGGTHVALILVELDDFAQVSAAHGPSAADLVLVGISEELLRCVRASDVLGHLDAERFAMLLPNTNLQGAMVVADRARSKLAARTFHGSDGPFQVTACLGVAVLTGAECRGQEGELLSAAESGLSTAKATGRSRIMVGSAVRT
jgi:diguanylate cyclase (GGDEF)-like protein